MTSVTFRVKALLGFVTFMSILAILHWSRALMCVEILVFLIVLVN